MTLKRLRHISHIPTSSPSLVSVAELPSTNQDAMFVIVKTYKRADVARHGLESCVAAEREALVRLSKDHSGSVPRLLNAHVTPLYLNLVMTLAPGVPASNLPCPLPLHRVVRIVRSLVCASSIAHGFGIVHADIALRNVIVDSKNRDSVCLVDYGSSFVTGSKTHDLSQTTTANIIPPEFLSSSTPDPTADIWAIGIFAWACMFGDGGPFHGQTCATILHIIEMYKRGEFDIADRFWEAFQKLGVRRSTDWLHAHDFVNICLSREPALRFAMLNSNTDFEDWRYVVDYKRMKAHPFLQADNCSCTPLKSP